MALTPAPYQSHSLPQEICNEIIDILLLEAREDFDRDSRLAPRPRSNGRLRLTELETALSLVSRAWRRQSSRHIFKVANLGTYSAPITDERLNALSTLMEVDNSFMRYMEEVCISCVRILDAKPHHAPIFQQLAKTIRKLHISSLHNIIDIDDGDDMMSLPEARRKDSLLGRGIESLWRSSTLVHLVFVETTFYPLILLEATNLRYLELRQALVTGPVGKWAGRNVQFRLKTLFFLGRGWDVPENDVLKETCSYRIRHSNGVDGSIFEGLEKLTIIYDNDAYLALEPVMAACTSTLRNLEITKSKRSFDSKQRGFVSQPCLTFFIDLDTMSLDSYPFNFPRFVHLQHLYLTVKATGMGLGFVEMPHFDCLSHSTTGTAFLPHLQNLGITVEARRVVADEALRLCDYDTKGWDRLANVLSEFATPSLESFNLTVNLEIAEERGQAAVDEERERSDLSVSVQKCVDAATGSRQLIVKLSTSIYVDFLAFGFW